MKEYKDEPMSDKESFASDYGRLPDEFPREYWNYYRRGFKKGEENQKQRHRETQSFEEWWIAVKEDFLKREVYKDQAQEIWQACKKSHGLE